MKEAKPAKQEEKREKEREIPPRYTEKYSE